MHDASCGEIFVMLEIAMRTRKSSKEIAIISESRLAVWQGAVDKDTWKSESGRFPFFFRLPRVRNSESYDSFSSAKFGSRFLDRVVFLILVLILTHFPGPNISPFTQGPNSLSLKGLRKMSKIKGGRSLINTLDSPVLTWMIALQLFQSLRALLPISYQIQNTQYAGTNHLPAPVPGHFDHRYPPCAKTRSWKWQGSYWIQKS